MLWKGVPKRRDARTPDLLAMNLDFFFQTKYKLNVLYRKFERKLLMQY